MCRLHDHHIIYIKFDDYDDDRQYLSTRDTIRAMTSWSAIN